MTQVLRTTRRMVDETGETVTWEAYASLDGQGLPSYDSPVDLDGCVVVPYDAVTGAREAGEQFVIGTDGSRIATPYTLYFEGDAVSVPNKEDRITLSGGEALIVAERTTVSGLFYSRAQPDHYEIRCRLE